MKREKLRSKLRICLPMLLLFVFLPMTRLPADSITLTGLPEKSLNPNSNFFEKWKSILQPYLIDSWNEGFKAGVEKFYPSYQAYEHYSGQLEKKIEGKDMVISEKDIELEEKQKEIFQLEQKNNTMKWVAGIGIPAAGIGLFIVGMLAGKNRR